MNPISDNPAPNTIRLLIADDQPVILRGLSMMLGSEDDIEIIGEANDGVEVATLATQLDPDVIIMDLQMPRKSGVEATREITQNKPNIKVVVLTTFDTDNMVFDAIRAGAQAYLLKDAEEQDVLKTVRAVHRGESTLSPQIARRVMEQFRAYTDQEPADFSMQNTPDAVTPAQPEVTQADSLIDDWAHELTAKEKEVLTLIAAGKSNKHISDRLALAEGTVKNYVSSIMSKLHVHSRTALAARVHRS